MAEETNYDLDFDEYQALEAEAEALARGEKKGNVNNNTVPMQTQSRPAPVQPAMVPARVGVGGREVKASRVTVVPAMEARKQQERIQQQALEQEKMQAQMVKNQEEAELASVEELENEMSGEEEAAEAEPKPQKWVAFHQPEKIGIINTETKEIIEGYKDIGSATGMAKMLNEIDSIIVSGGYN